MTGPTDIQRIAAELADFWRGHGYQVVLAALVAVAALLAVSLVVAKRRGRVDRWVATLAGFAVLALSAEGMWVIAREKLHLPVILAASVFFVAEATMVSSAMQANRYYVEHRHPGKHGRAVWVIAAVAGVIVAFNSKSWVEAPLRLALPLAAAYLWWNALTADGTTKPAGRWRWTPTRLLEWLGAIEPDTARDLAEVNRARRVAAMTVTAHRLHSGGRLAQWHAARLRRLALAADDDMVAEVQRRVARVNRIAELTAPVATTPANEPATVATGEPAAKPASGTGWPPATAVAVQPVTKPAKVATAKSPVVPVTELPESARQIAKLRARNPKLTQAQVVEKTGISERTVQRHWAATTPAVEPATTPVNGTSVPTLIDA